MGITGAGGAIIAIPLFQVLLGSTIKEATILSLIAVLFGTVVNLVGRTGEVKWKIAAGFAIFGTISNYLTIPLKMRISETFIAMSLVGIGLFSLWSVWKSQKALSRAFLKVSIIKIALIGLLLGLVTTLTGLGGGVLLIPILLRVFGMTYEEALPTSLTTIFLISFSALIFQGPKTIELINASDILLIGLGALVGFGSLKYSLKSINENKKLLLRKIVFSVATLVSLIIVLIKTF